MPPTLNEKPVDGFKSLEEKSRLICAWCRVRHKSVMIPILIRLSHARYGDFVGRVHRNTPFGSAVIRPHFQSLQFRMDWRNLYFKHEHNMIFQIVSRNAQYCYTDS